MLPTARLRRPLTLAAALGACLLAIPAAAGAAGPQVTVAPQQLDHREFHQVSFFDQTVKPGGLLQARILVKNLGTTPARVALDPVDAQTAENLGSAYRPRGLSVHGPTRWMRIARRRVSLAPGQELPLTILVAVPRRARPGDYLSGISVQVLNQQPKTTKAKGAQVNSKQRYAIGALVRVPGPRHPLIRFTGASVGFEPGGVTFRLRARNRGNEILQNVNGTAVISRGGSRVVVARMGPGTFVTGTAINFPITATKQHPRGGTRYRVKAVLRYHGGVARLDTVVRFSQSQAQTQQEFGGPPAKDNGGGGIPPWLWGLGGGLLGAGALARLLRRRPRGRGSVSEGNALALLERELAGVGERGRPVSVVVLPDTPEDHRTRARIIKTLEPRLRATDVVADRNGKGIVIILPDTSERAAAGQVEDMSRVLQEVDGLAAGPRIGAATAAEPTSAGELLDRAARNASGASA